MMTTIFNIELLNIFISTLTFIVKLFYNVHLINSLPVYPKENKKLSICILSCI